MGKDFPFELSLGGAVETEGFFEKNLICLNGGGRVVTFPRQHDYLVAEFPEHPDPFIHLKRNTVHVPEFSGDYSDSVHDTYPASWPEKSGPILPRQRGFFEDMSSE